VTIASLESLPPNQDIHLWADYVELLCMTDLDGVLSKSDLIDRVLERRTIDQSASDSAEPAGPVSQSAADHMAARAEDIFQHLEYRAAAFGSSYPFTLESASLLGRAGRMTARRKLYLFLLLASSLRLVKKSSRFAVTREFERLGQAALRAWLPKRASVYLFGTSAPRGSRYHGALFSKLSRLASDISERLLLDENDLRAGDAGDAGADIVGWLPLGDSNRSRMVVLAQATCQMDWTGKQHQSSANAWRPLITFAAEPANVLLIPYCYRGGDGSWHINRTIQNTILVDRLRLTRILDASRVISESVGTVVDEALAFREPLT
jgi:hypothetical protein